VGEQSYPANTILIRPTVQQEEMDQHGQEFIERFSRQSAGNKELLHGVKLRTPDILFDGEMTLELGGVSARLFWLGTAHTRGDEMIFVKEDRSTRASLCRIMATCPIMATWVMVP
jgi:hypothetical protein